jgi:hypothetical protein
MASPRSILALLKFLWENADHLADLLQKLPPALRNAGDGLVTAGDGALLVGRGLGGESSGEPGAASSLKEATAAIRQVERHVQELAGEIRTMADALDEVRIPTISPVKQRFNLRLAGLGEPELVTGITIGEQRLPVLGNLSTRLRAQAAGLEGTLPERLETAAGHLDRLSEALERSGQRMRTVGGALQDGGRALAEFAS